MLRRGDSRAGKLASRPTTPNQLSDIAYLFIYSEKNRMMS
jgi:hypothetical protein